MNMKEILVLYVTKIFINLVQTVTVVLLVDRDSKEQVVFPTVSDWAQVTVVHVVLEHISQIMVITYAQQCPLAQHQIMTKMVGIVVLVIIILIIVANYVPYTLALRLANGVLGVVTIPEEPVKIVTITVQQGKKKQGVAELIVVHVHYVVTENINHLLANIFVLVVQVVL
jgi:hypothetical protein